MVEDLPSNTEDVDSIPGQETKILHDMGQLTPHATAKNWHIQINKEKSVFKKKKKRKKEKWPWVNIW